MKILSTLFFCLISIFAQAGTAPTFTVGTTQNLTICQSSLNNFLAQQLRVKDVDANDTLTYKIVSNAAHGSLNGFPNYIISNGAINTPNYFSYTPTLGYAGTDTFTISVTDGVYTTQTTINITVNSLPIVAPIISGDSVCKNKSLTLKNATTGGVWSTTNFSIAAINGSTGVLVPLGLGVVGIKYTITSNGCSNTAIKNIEVLDVPTVAPITGNLTICMGSTTKLSCASKGGFWSSDGDYALLVDSSGVVRNVNYSFIGLTGTISYYLPAANGCVGVSFTNVTLSGNPTIAGIYGGSAANCIGTPIQMGNATVGGVWSNKNSSVTTINTVGLVSPITAGMDTIVYTITDGNGC